MDPQDDGSTEDPSEGMKALREAAEAGKTARAEAEQLRRENAFLKAGVSTDGKLAEMFAKTYDGELTPEAIRAEAAEISADLVAGTTTTSTPPSTDTPDPAEQAQTAERAAFAAEQASTVGGAPDVHPGIAGHQDFRERVAQGQSRESAISAVIHPLVNAAANGDPRARFDGWSEDEMQSGAILR